MNISRRAFLGTAALTVGALIGSVNAQTGNRLRSQNHPNMDCVERIQIPRYPPLAEQARIEGSITASVLLSSDGTVHDIETTAESRFRQAKNLFGSPVETVIRAAKFRSGCSEKIIKLVFHFDLSGASPHPGESFSFGYPNVFWIVAEAQTVQP